MEKPVMCIVPSRSQADSLVDKLLKSGFWDADISVLLSHTPDTTESPVEENTKAAGGVVAGAGTGGAIGGTLGLLAGLGLLVIPGAGPFLAAGPILAALSGGLAGVGIGGTAGGIIGLGIPEHEARGYEVELKRGQVLVAVHPKNEEERARAQGIVSTVRRIPVEAPRSVVDSLKS